MGRLLYSTLVAEPGHPKDDFGRILPDTRHKGTNAIPFILANLAAQDGKAKRWCEQWLFLHNHEAPWTTEERRHNYAQIDFNELDAATQSAARRC